MPVARHARTQAHRRQAQASRPVFFCWCFFCGLHTVGEGAGRQTGWARALDKDGSREQPYSRLRPATRPSAADNLSGTHGTRNGMPVQAVSAGREARHWTWRSDWAATWSHSLLDAHLVVLKLAHAHGFLVVRVLDAASEACLANKLAGLRRRPSYKSGHRQLTCAVRRECGAAASRPPDGAPTAPSPRRRPRARMTAQLAGRPAVGWPAWRCVGPPSG